MFEVKEGRARDPADLDGLTIDVDDDAIKLNRKAGDHLRGASITGARQPRRRARGLGHQPDLARGRARARHLGHLAAHHAVAGRPGPDRVQVGGGAHQRPAEPGPEQRLADWRRQSPLVKASDARLATVFAASTEDLGSCGSSTLSTPTGR